MAADCGIQRIFFDYDSTLNPGQGSEALSPSRSELLMEFLSRWHQAGVRIFVLTSSNPDVKNDALEKASLRKYFEDILSTSMPKKFPSKGDFLEERTMAEGWNSLKQILVDDSVEAVASTAGWKFTSPDEARKGVAVSNTFRLVQHSTVGLTKKDLEHLDKLIFGPTPKIDQHYFSGTHNGSGFVDEADTDLKCMEFTVNKLLLSELLKSNPDMVEGRPDFADIIKGAAKTSSSEINAEIGAKSSGYPESPKGGGKGKSRGPPPPPVGMKSPKDAGPVGMKSPSKTAEDPGDGQGSRVEVLEGPHKGKCGIVLKKSEDANGPRWRILVEGGGGPPTWVDSVKVLSPPQSSEEPSSEGPADGGKPASVPSSKKDAAEGDEVKILTGPNEGRVGSVIKLVGDETGKRFRVRLDSISTTWAEEVEVIKEAPKPQGASAGGGDPFGMGATVEIADGPNAGKRGKVLKVLGDSTEDRRWKLELSPDRSTTWATAVLSEGGVHSSTIKGNAAPSTPVSSPVRPPMGSILAGVTRKQVPCPDPETYLVDDSDSEVSDAEMPELVRG